MENLAFINDDNNFDTVKIINSVSNVIPIIFDDTKENNNTNTNTTKKQNKDIKESKLKESKNKITPPKLIKTSNRSNNANSFVILNPYIKSNDSSVEINSVIKTDSSIKLSSFNNPNMADLFPHNLSEQFAQNFNCNINPFVNIKETPCIPKNFIKFAESMASNIISSLSVMEKENSQPKTKNHQHNKEELAVSNENKVQYNNGKITGRYDKDLNILQIHNLIMEFFDTGFEKRRKDINTKMEEMKQLLTQPQTFINRRETKKNYAKLQEQLNKITSRSDEDRYLQEVRELIDAYKEIGPVQNVISFEQEHNRDKDIELKSNKFNKSLNFNESIKLSDESYRHLIISRYLDIAKQYFNIDISKIIHKEISCPACGELIVNSNDHNNSDDNYGSGYCTNCGEEFSVLVSTSASLSNLRSNDWEHILKRLLEIQGCQKDNLPYNIYELLDAYFTKIGFPIGAGIKKNNNSASLGLGINIKERTSIKLMIDALHKLKMPNLYKDVYLICKNYWGWELINTELLECMMAEYFHEFRSIYDTIKGNRKSFLNRDYVIFRLLERTGNFINPSFFDMIETNASFKFHELTWMKGCEILGWPEPKQISSNYI